MTDSRNQLAVRIAAVTVPSSIARKTIFVKACCLGPILAAFFVACVGCSPATSTPSVSQPAAPSGKPLRAPMFAQPSVMLEATQQAWAGMQAIDAEANNTNPGPYPSKLIQQVTYAYSLLPLTNVDPAFVQHLRRYIDGLKRTAATFAQIEAKRDEMDSQESHAAEFGSALGAAVAAGDGASPQQAAGIGNILGIMAAAGASAGRSQVDAEFANAIRQIEAELKALDQAEAQLAEYLTQKYGVPFIDPF